MLMRRVALQASRCGSNPISRSWTGFRYSISRLRDLAANVVQRHPSILFSKTVSNENFVALDVFDKMENVIAFPFYKDHIVNLYFVGLDWGDGHKLATFDAAAHRAALRAHFCEVP